ncbi:MAG: hypothetical protein LUH10_05875 [Tannerellaceae bacterium]|nr:hypothetical protein [Tannerellaceae bacterium]
MLKKLLIIFLYVCIVSCTKEIVIHNNDDNITYTEGNLTVYLENMEVSTKSGWPYDDYFSSSDIYEDDCKPERGLFNSLLVSFDSNFLLEYYTKTITGIYYYPPAIDNIAKGRGTAYTAFTLGTGDITLTTGAHYFYVLCNLSEEMHNSLLDWLDREQGSLVKDDFERKVLSFPLDTLVKKFEGWDAPNALHSSQRCMMTNMVSPAPDYMASKDQNSTGSYPSTNNVTSYIGKAFAKASLAYIPENEAHNRLSDVRYRVINVPKNIYLLPNIFDNQVETPHFEKNYQNGYSNFNEYYEEWFDDTYQLPTTDDDNWLEATTDKDQTNKTHVYCMENGNKTPLQGNSTFLLVKAKYNPLETEWLNKDGSKGTKTSNGTFWRIKRAGYYTAGYYNEEPDITVLGSGEPVEYPQGTTYYPIWLQTDGNYEVRRNGFYKIALTQVLSAGAPSLDSVIDPVAPLDKTTRESSFTKSGTEYFPDINTGIRWEQGGI